MFKWINQVAPNRLAAAIGSIALLAAGLKMAQLHPKPIPRNPPPQGETEAPPGAEARATKPEGSSGS